MQLYLLHEFALAVRYTLTIQKVRHAAQLISRVPLFAAVRDETNNLIMSGKIICTYLLYSGPRYTNAAFAARFADVMSVHQAAAIGHRGGFLVVCVRRHRRVSLSSLFYVLAII